MDDHSAIGVRHNAEKNRFEAEAGSEVAVAEYMENDGTIHFVHTLVPEEFEGQGIGNSLARAGLDYARSQGLMVVPRCRFIAAYIERHPEYQDLVEARGA